MKIEMETANERTQIASHCGLLLLAKADTLAHHN